ncbi:NAD-dependent epimerase/dehydratase family protein [Loktanella sp. DJP18]|uniref:NAD-dependent epimerase/dehydratase family protein n=1 Tax=Loktanella sp. DJP18 TaxID=3409788 RepID=UPI003BB7E136
MSLRILMTGATGFVGRAIISHLGDANLHIVSRRPVTGTGHWHHADLRDAAQAVTLIRTVRPDILIHAAWETEHGAFWHADSNRDWLAAGKAMFDAMKRMGGQRIVSLGTCAEYPFSNHPLSEDKAGPAPATVYGQTKLELLRHLHGLGISYAWPRIFHCYGAGEDPRRLVPKVVAALAAGQPIACSSGTQKRDFMEVRDTGRTVAALSLSNVDGAINLGSGESVTIGQVAGTLGAIAGRPDLIHLGALPDRPGDPPVLVPDLTRQRESLRFSPNIPLKTGLHDAFAHWSQSLQPTPSSLTEKT